MACKFEMSWHVSLSTWHTSFRKPFFVDEFLAPRQQSGRAGAAGAARGVVRGVKGFAPRARARVPCTSPRTMRAPGRPRMATKPARSENHEALFYPLFRKRLMPRQRNSLTHSLTHSCQTQVKLKSNSSHTHSLTHSHDLVNGFRKNVI